MEYYRDKFNKKDYEIKDPVANAATAVEGVLDSGINSVYYKDKEFNKNYNIDKDKMGSADGVLETGIVNK
jgi:hypothetical protein